MWSKTGGEGCEATYRTRWIRESRSGEVEELGVVDKLVLAAGNEAYELVTDCGIERREVDCEKEFGLEFDPNDTEPLAPEKDTEETALVHLGLRRVSTGATVDPLTGNAYLAPKRPVKMAAFEGGYVLKTYTDLPFSSGGSRFFVASRSIDLGDACGMVGNVTQDDTTVLVYDLTGTAKAVAPKITGVPATLQSAAAKAAEAACRECVLAITEEEDEGECKGHPIERVASVAPVFEGGKLRSRWSMLTDAPIGACRQAGDYMVIELVDDTIPSEWSVPALPAVVARALSALGPGALAKTEEHKPVGWTEVSPEAFSAGHVTRAFGK